MMVRVRMLGAVVLIVAAVGSVSTASAAQPLPVHRAAVVHAAAEPIEVTVVDQLEGRWYGLPEAVAGWNRSPLVHLTIRPSCPVTLPCVIVRARDYHQPDWSGLTTYPSDLMSLVRADTDNLRDRYRTHFRQSALLCHELGHALGMVHPDPATTDPKTRGCIASVDDTLITPVASDADLAFLATVPSTGGSGGGVLGHH